MREVVWQGATIGTRPRLSDFVREPHTAIVGANEGVILNLVDRRADAAQNAMLEIASEKPERTVSELRSLSLPRHHEVRMRDVDLRRLGAVLAVSYERQLRDFASLLLVENLGPRTLQTLALVAEVVHGAPSRFSDPARFSFALGGKDGHPFPVPLKTYDESLGVLRRSLDAAKLGRSEKIDGFKRLDSLVRHVESSAAAPEAKFREVLAHERAISSTIGGRTVMDD